MGILLESGLFHLHCGISDRRDFLIDDSDPLPLMLIHQLLEVVCDPIIVLVQLVYKFSGYLDHRSDNTDFELMITSPSKIVRGIVGIHAQMFNLIVRTVRGEEDCGALTIYGLIGGNENTLVNSVYLYVVTVRGWDGSVIRSEVRKLVILR